MKKRDGQLLILSFQGIWWCGSMMLTINPESFTIADLKLRVAEELRRVSKSPGMKVSFDSAFLCIDMSFRREDDGNLYKRLSDMFESDLIRDFFGPQRLFRCRINFEQPPSPALEDVSSLHEEGRVRLMMELVLPVAKQQATESKEIRKQQNQSKASADGMRFEDLPNEMLAYCFDFLNFVDCVRMKFTNRRFFELLSTEMNNNKQCTELEEIILLARNVKFLTPPREAYAADGICAIEMKSRTWCFIQDHLFPTNQDELNLFVLPDDISSRRYACKSKERKQVEEQEAKQKEKNMVVPLQFAMMEEGGHFDGYDHRGWRMRICGKEKGETETDKDEEKRIQTNFWYQSDEMDMAIECGPIDWVQIEEWKNKVMETLREQQQHNTLNNNSMKKKVVMSNEMFLRILFLCGVGRSSCEFIPDWYMQEETPKEYQSKKDDRQKATTYNIKWQL